MNQEYAEQIAEKWNTKDEFSGYCGIITKFQLSSEYLSKYEVHNVGGLIHNELWVPSERLSEFNSQIIDTIEIVKVFIGNDFNEEAQDEATCLVRKYIDK